MIRFCMMQAVHSSTSRRPFPSSVDSRVCYEVQTNSLQIHCKFTANILFDNMNLNILQLSSWQLSPPFCLPHPCIVCNAVVTNLLQETYVYTYARSFLLCLWKRVKALMYLWKSLWTEGWVIIFCLNSSCHVPFWLLMSWYIWARLSCPLLCCGRVSFSWQLFAIGRKRCCILIKSLSFKTTLLSSAGCPNFPTLLWSVTWIHNTKSLLISADWYCHISEDGNIRHIWETARKTCFFYAIIDLCNSPSLLVLPSWHSAAAAHRRMQCDGFLLLIFQGGAPRQAYLRLCRSLVSPLHLLNQARSVEVEGGCKWRARLPLLAVGPALLLPAALYNKSVLTVLLKCIEPFYDSLLDYKESKRPQIELRWSGYTAGRWIGEIHNDALWNPLNDNLCKAWALIKTIHVDLLNLMVSTSTDNTAHLPAWAMAATRQTLP